MPSLTKLKGKGKKEQKIKTEEPKKEKKKKKGDQPEKPKIIPKYEELPPGELMR